MSNDIKASHKSLNKNQQIYIENKITQEIKFINLKLTRLNDERITTRWWR